MSRRCRKCGATLHPFNDVCDACGTTHRERMPWYTPLVGAVLFLLLFLFAVDLDGLSRVLDRLLGQAGP